MIPVISGNVTRIIKVSTGNRVFIEMVDVLGVRATKYENITSMPPT